MWKHLKTSPTHIRLHTRKTCVFWMKSTADRSFSLLSSGKVDTSLCNCENVFCTCRFFAAFCYAIFYSYLQKSWGCFLLWLKSCLVHREQLCLLSFVTCDLAIVKGEPLGYYPGPVIFLHKHCQSKIHAQSKCGETIHAHKNSPPPPPPPPPAK